jgi:hypothetical protein
MDTKSLSAFGRGFAHQGIQGSPLHFCVLCVLLRQFLQVSYLEYPELEDGRERSQRAQSRENKKRLLLGRRCAGQGHLGSPFRFCVLCVLLRQFLQVSFPGYPELEDGRERSQRAQRMETSFDNRFAGQCVLGFLFHLVFPAFFCG